MLIMRSLDVEVFGRSVYEGRDVDPDGHDAAGVGRDVHGEDELYVLAVYLVHTRRLDGLPKVFKCGERDVDGETPHSLV
jgi:hypothetical protein